MLDVNNKNIHLLFDDEVQSVPVVFEVGGKPYTYLTRNDVKAGQPVVTSVSGDIDNMDLRVGYALDDSGALDIDWGSNIDYKYIVSVVDVESWQFNLNEQTRKIVQSRKLARESAKNKLRDEFKAMYGDKIEHLLTNGKGEATGNPKE